VSATHLERALWPVERIGEALALLARAARIPPRDVRIERVPPTIARDRRALGAWLDGAAQSLGLELHELTASAQAVEAELALAPPAIVTVGAEPRVAVVVRHDRRGFELLAPDGARIRARPDALVQAVRGDTRPDLVAVVDRLIDRARIAPARQTRARSALLDRLGGNPFVEVGWRLAVPPSAPVWNQLRDAGVLASARAVVVTQVAVQALVLASWSVIGRGALQGQVEHGWLFAWALLLVTAVLPRAMASWAQGTGAMRAAIVIKRRLLNGALRLAPEEVRHLGAGEILGRVIESNALESLVTSGGLTTLVALVEIGVAAAVLVLAPGGGLAAAGFAVALGISFWLARATGRALDGWTESRLEMTQDLIERMVGHRTRLAQEPKELWHEEEDVQLAGYAQKSATVDRFGALTQGALPRAWLVLGVVAIAPDFVRDPGGGARIAVAVGGLLLGYRALMHLTAGLNSLLRARVAWVKTRPLFESGAREERVGSPGWAAAGTPSSEPSLIDARDIRFRYPARHEPVLRGVNLRVARHDRLLLEGPSGGGKSTLGAILAGLRAPDSGLLLMGGLDPQTLGESGWRRRVVAAPQFHENHVITATLAFNLLMGRHWPPRMDDLQEAEEVCRELGLGALLERMPSGMMQMVGETGWQLSHGERSRVFIARALLQRAELIVLDESFAALDPLTLDQALQCVLRRAPALVVIAHP
jgi:ATP-binding cassette subfamily B protein